MMFNLPGLKFDDSRGGNLTFTTDSLSHINNLATMLGGEVLDFGGGIYRIVKNGNNVAAIEFNHSYFIHIHGSYLFSSAG